eukprot:g51114.t1
MRFNVSEDQIKQGEVLDDKQIYMGLIAIAMNCAYQPEEIGIVDPAVTKQDYLDGEYERLQEKKLVLGVAYTDAYHWVPHWRCNSQVYHANTLSGRRRIPHAVKNIMRKVYTNGIRYAKDPTYLEVRAQQQGWEGGYLSLALLWLVCHKYEDKDISKEFDLPKIPSWMYALLHEGKSEEPPMVKTST